MRHCSVMALLLVAALSVTTMSRATEVGVVGLFPGKAVVVIDGGRPHTLAIGATSPQGVKLKAVEVDAAVVEFDGKRHRIGIGEQVFAHVDERARSGGTIHLTADAQGHFFAIGSLNGVSVRFLVDTGATLVSLGASDALRAGIKFTEGQPQVAMTANGAVRVWKIKLNTVRVGEVTLHNVDAAVHERDLPVALLGMSFLNRMEMQREGEAMTLRRRF